MASTLEAPGLDLAELESVAQQELERWQVPGVEVVAVRDGQVVFAGGFGKRHVARDLPVTERTLFAHGSTGKAFTAFLAGLLVDEGLLAWDRPVREYLPEIRFADSYTTDHVTLRDLLCHRTGLPRHDLAWIANPDTSRAELLGRLRYLEANKELRQLFQYNNFGFTLAGHLIGAVTGSTYEEQLRLRVLEPLGMTRTLLETPAVLADGDHAQPYADRSGEVVEIDFRPLDNFCPAGGIFSCAVDTARWLLLQSGGGEIDGGRLLSEGTFRETHTLQMPINEPNPMADPDVEFSGYAFGWLAGRYRGRRLSWHNGGIDGFLTEFMILPDQKIGVATCNNKSSLLSVVMARLVADRLLSETGRDWGADLHEQAEKLEALGKEQRAAKVVVPGTAPSHALEDYAGRYEHPGYGSLELAVAEGGLTARLGALDLNAKHRHYDTWDLSYGPFEAAGELAATFFTDAGGKVAEVLVALEPAVDPIRFKRGADDRLHDPEFLSRLAGAYEAGPITVEIRVDADAGLVLEQSGVTVHLVPASGLAFTAKEQSSLRVEFTVPADGLATELRSSGFTLKRKA